MNWQYASLGGYKLVFGSYVAYVNPGWTWYVLSQAGSVVSRAERPYGSAKLAQRAAFRELSRLSNL